MKRFVVVAAVFVALVGCELSSSTVIEGEGEGDAGEGEGEGEGEGGEGEGEGDVGEGEGEGDAGEGEGEGEGDVGGCRVQSDCDNDGGSCTHPDAPGGCGIGPPDFEDECASSADCAGGNVCDFVDDGCGGDHLGCVPPCGLDPTCVAGAQCDCGDGELCRSGRCEAATCQADGFDCAVHRACDAAPRDPLTDDRDHGCSLIGCVADDDCVSGFCVVGACSLTPGRCELPRP